MMIYTDFLLETRMNIMKTLLLSFCLLLLLPFFSLAQQEDAKNSNPIEKLDSTKYKIGNVILDSKERTITVNGKINMQQGTVELIACAPGGKMHESILTIDVVPYHLQVSLLLLGLKYVGGVEYQGDAKQPQGDSVYITITWQLHGKDTTVAIEDLVWNIEQNRQMERTSWVFVGSKTVEGTFMADQEKSLITTYHDPFTIFDNPLKGGSNDELYKVNEHLVPSKGTPVQIVIKPVP